LGLMKIEIRYLFVSDGHNYYGRYGKGSLNHEVSARESVELVAGSGIVGDRFFDYKEDYKGQITFFSQSTIDAVRDELGHKLVEGQMFRRNVVLAGVDAESLIGKHFRIGDCEFTGSCEAAPCFWMDEAVGAGTHEFLEGRGGLRARITRGGTLALGEQKLEILADVSVGESKEKKKD
jgi:MOSC domain-containing protein YiiM